MGGIEYRAARRLVHAARLHTDEAILDDVGAADAVLAGDFVELFEELYGPEWNGVYADRIAFFEAYRDDDRLVRRLEGILGHDEDVLGRFLRRIFEDAALVRAVPQVTVGGVRLLRRRLHRHALGVHVGDEVFAALEFPFAPRRDDLQLGGERGVGQLEADLVVALAGAAVGDRVGAESLRDGDLVRCGERPCHRRPEQIRAGVDGAGPQCREDEIAHEFFAQVFDDAVFGTGALGLLDKTLQLAGALPDIGGEADDARAIGVA